MTHRIDLLTIFTDTPELQHEIVSYMCKYDDDRFIFRQLSRSFYYLSLYEKLKVARKHPPSFLRKFFKLYKIRKLHLCEHHRKIYKLPLSLFASLQKITVDSMEARDFYFFCKYFSRLPIISLTINYCTCKLPDNILWFNKLKTLNITITSKENENVVFELLKTNKETLQKLKIGVYTGRNVNEDLLVRTIEDHLSLESISIRDDLFTYKMIKPKMRTIQARFVYVPNHITDLRNILSLRMYDIRNCDLAIILSTLECVEWVSLTGVLSNIDNVKYSDNYKYKRLIFKPWRFEPDNHDEPYDNTTCDDIYVKSRNLSGMYLSTFTINRLVLSNPNIFTKLYITDVLTQQPLFFPKLIELKIDNFNLNPELHAFRHLRLPRIRNLSLHCLLLHNDFFYPSLRSLSIQNSIVSIDILHTLKRHKSIKNILFYHNEWGLSYDPRRLTTWMHSKKIEYYDGEDW